MVIQPLYRGAITALVLYACQVGSAASQPGPEALADMALPLAEAMINEPNYSMLINAREPACDDDGSRALCRLTFPPGNAFASYVETAIYYGGPRKSVMVTMRLNPDNTSIIMMSRLLTHAIRTMGFPAEVASACDDIEKTGPVTSLTFEEYGHATCTLWQDGITGRKIQFSLVEPQARP